MINVFWLILVAVILHYWWHSGNYKGRARSLATDYCRQLDLQLLDQSMVICGLWPQRDADGSLSLRRSYQFEFTSTGDQRYQGNLQLSGMNLQSIQLEAYKIAESK